MMSTHTRTHMRTPCSISAAASVQSGEPGARSLGASTTAAHAQYPPPSWLAGWACPTMRSTGREVSASAAWQAGERRASKCEREGATKVTPRASTGGTKFNPGVTWHYRRSGSANAELPRRGGRHVSGKQSLGQVLEPAHNEPAPRLHVHGGRIVSKYPGVEKHIM